MSDHHKGNAGWAQENGYEFHAKSEGVIFEGARSLDIFRKADSYRDHVLGVHRNRPFEILDAWVETHDATGEGGFGGYGFVWETIVVIPTSGLKLPNFDLLPRREAGGLNFLGIKGLDLKVAPTAPPDEQRLVEAFNKSYSLFAGGAYEAMEAAIKSADHLVPSLSDMAAICKPSVLRFLTTAVTGFIEVQDGYLAIRAPEKARIYGPDVSHTILEGRERESLLTVANDFLDVLANAANETSLHALSQENTFRPGQFLGTFIGAVIGFFGGLFASIILLVVFKGDYLFLAPLPILGGVVLGQFLGKMLTGAK
jgi:hypothetical protein